MSHGCAVSRVSGRWGLGFKVIPLLLLQFGGFGCSGLVLSGLGGSGSFSGVHGNSLLVHLGQHGSSGPMQGLSVSPVRDSMA